ncbi:MAG: 30S ribosomal protein S1 [Deltaproteobacteria bacterium]|nr:30S ribosomal protein S1 [Deltaproteobacteria bacterium]
MEQEPHFSEFLEENINVPDRGEIFKGKVVRVDEDDVFIDFGFKSEGIAPIHEFYGRSGEPEVGIGDEVDVILEEWVGNSGLPKLSKKRADIIKEHQRIDQIYQNGKLIKGNIREKVNGGLIVDIGENAELRAFLPASQIDLRPQRNLDKFIGKNIEAKIVKLTDRGMVLSIRAHLEEQREVKRKKALSTLEEGKIVSGKVTKIIDQGVFIDLDGVEGFLPISEISWGRIRHPSDIINLDETLRVKVIKLESDAKITLGLKQTKPDPWTLVERKYKPGSKIRGKVVSIVDFGIFVELEPGVEGLVHTSEIAWIKRFRHPSEVVNVGRRVETMVLEVDPEKKRIALSLKQIDPSPWETFKEQFPPGTRINGKVKNINEKGVFVELSEDLVGLVRPGEISWKGRVNPIGLFVQDQDIEVVVLNVDEKNQKIGLGIKQLNKDPWEGALERYKPGETALTGKVISIKDRGIVLELENKVEGYIRANEFDPGTAKDSNSIVKIGDIITAQVTGFNRRKKQVNLSKKRYEQQLEKERISSFLSSQGESSVKLGELLEKKLKSISRQD